MTERAAPPATVRELDGSAYVAAIPALAALLVDAVEGGASVNFLAGVTHEEAAAWWAERIEQVRDGVISAFVATDGEAIVGSTLLERSRNPNSPHRAEIGKVLVLQTARRRGIASALMAAAEDRARADGRWMLILDTVTGSAAETFYRSKGWQELGIMPNHALATDGTPAATTFFWKISGEAGGWTASSVWGTRGWGARGWGTRGWGTRTTFTRWIWPGRAFARRAPIEPNPRLDFRETVFTG